MKRCGCRHGCVMRVGVVDLIAHCLRFRVTPRPSSGRRRVEASSKDPSTSATFLCVAVRDLKSTVVRQPRGFSLAFREECSQNTEAYPLEKYPPPPIFAATINVPMRQRPRIQNEQGQSTKGHMSALQPETLNLNPNPNAQTVSPSGSKGRGDAEDSRVLSQR